MHSKNNLFFIFFTTFFLWCRRYESALYGWVITTRSFTFFGSKINISPVIHILWLKYCPFHCQGRYWLLYAWMSLLISSWTKGLKWFIFPCSLSIFGNKPANNVCNSKFLLWRPTFWRRFYFILSYMIYENKTKNEQYSYILPSQLARVVYLMNTEWKHKTRT